MLKLRYKSSAILFCAAVLIPASAGSAQAADRVCGSYSCTVGIWGSKAECERSRQTTIMSGGFQVSPCRDGGGNGQPGGYADWYYTYKI